MCTRPSAVASGPSVVDVLELAHEAEAFVAAGLPCCSWCNRILTAFEEARGSRGLLEELGCTLASDQRQVINELDWMSSPMTPFVLPGSIRERFCKVWCKLHMKHSLWNESSNTKWKSGY